ncbi:MAG: molybdopterin-dependent oxidoreductase [Dehalococcoidia bacterium]
MSTRAVNTTLLLLTLAQVASGVDTLFVGAPNQRWGVWAHAAGGFAVIVLLVWKWRVIRRSLRRRGFGRWAAPSLALLTLLLVTLLTGVLWSTVGLAPLAGYPALTVHALASLFILALLTPHVRVKWRRPALRDVTSRRLALRRGLLVGGGVAAWLATEAVVRWAGLSGATRRFTGSRPAPMTPPNGFPATSWLLDSPEPLALDRWRLRVHGMVAAELTLSAADLAPAAALPAVLDCTGGWYAERAWQGSSLAALLNQAGASAGARSVVVTSATGYARRFPIGEAAGMLLATAVDGEPLSHGHGAPLRLVAPGRRGYEWVKWVVAIEVSVRSARWRAPLPLS